MARLLDDLFDVSRILEGRFELNKEDIDLREVIRAAVETLTPSLEASPALLTTDLPTVELPVRGDARRIQHVVVHLLSNAVRYSPPGAHIQLSAHANADSVILKVKDHGRGISPSMLVDIFELFVQDDQGLERSSGGLGIGLTLVRRIVELHGGDVHAYSEGVGRGSEFVVRFPRIAHAVTNDERRESRSAPAQRRVLIVEDQDDSRKMLRMLLESMGHVVVEEADGASAVRTIQREHPDVALIDIGLPVMSGYEVAHHVRENGLLDDVVLVALTGYGRDADIAAARAAGFDAHVTKPADSQLLNDILAGRVRPFIRSFGMAFEN
jgi:two-component system CheB/CheR fusion protein